MPRVGGSNLGPSSFFLLFLERKTISLRKWAGKKRSRNVQERSRRSGEKKKRKNRQANQERRSSRNLNTRLRGSVCRPSLVSGQLAMKKEDGSNYIYTWILDSMGVLYSKGSHMTWRTITIPDILDHKQAFFCPVFRPSFEYQTIWKPTQIYLLFYSFPLKHSHSRETVLK